MHVSRGRVLLASPVAYTRSIRERPSRHLSVPGKASPLPMNRPCSCLRRTELGELVIIVLAPLASLAASVECSLQCLRTGQDTRDPMVY
jgi:hypothetical protein